jgi:hypothetical protein
MCWDVLVWDSWFGLLLYSSSLFVLLSCPLGLPELGEELHGDEKDEFGSTVPEFTVGGCELECRVKV